MMGHEDLMRMRIAELRAEAHGQRAATRLARVRRAERRYRRAESRLDHARLRAAFAS